MQKGKKNRRCSDYHSQENVDIVQKMIEGDLAGQHRLAGKEDCKKGDRVQIVYS